MRVLTFTTVTETKKKRSGPGRPPRAGKTTSEARFGMRLTEAEYTRWNRAAEKAGVPLAEFVRVSVEAAIGKGTP